MKARADNKRWLIAYTKAGQELSVAKALKVPFRQRTVYFPKVCVERRHAGKRDFVIRPFLSRYGFVVEDGDSLGILRNTPGVVNVVRAGLDPVLVPQAIIDQLIARENERGFIQLDEDDPAYATTEFKRNDQVRVTRGPMEGISGVFRERDGARRAFIFIKQFKASVDLDDLELVL